MPVLTFLMVLERMLEVLIPLAVILLALRRLPGAAGSLRLATLLAVAYGTLSLALLFSGHVAGHDTAAVRAACLLALPVWLLLCAAARDDAPHRGRQASPGVLILKNPQPAPTPQFRSQRTA